MPHHTYNVTSGRPAIERPLSPVWSPDRGGATGINRSGFAGIVVLLTAAWKAFRPRHGVREKEIVARILVHPRPAWEEELAVRRLGADTAEICCVPFLQTRLAVGDVVRINARGYIGEVTRPSGRVTFEVRCAEDAATIDARLRSWEDDGRAEPAHRPF